MFQQALFFKAYLYLNTHCCLFKVILQLYNNLLCGSGDLISTHLDTLHFFGELSELSLISLRSRNSNCSFCSRTSKIPLLLTTLLIAEDGSGCCGTIWCGNITCPPNHGCLSSRPVGLRDCNTVKEPVGGSDSGRCKHLEELEINLLDKPTAAVERKAIWERTLVLSLPPNMSELSAVGVSPSCLVCWL